MKRKVGIALGVALLGGAALAAGMFAGYPLIGGAQYCMAFQGDGTTCSQYAPAGPTTFAGTEAFPVDINPTGTVQSGPSTALVALPQVGQGPMVDQTTVGTTQTIPNNTPWFFLDGAQGSALTVTMPAGAVEGQIQRVVCEAATVGTLTVSANTGQTLKGNPNAACVAGVGYSWRYQASNTTWYRF